MSSGNVKRHPKRMRRICCRDEEDGKKIKASSCELKAVSCQLKVLNDGGRQGVIMRGMLSIILSGSERSIE